MAGVSRRDVLLVAAGGVLVAGAGAVAVAVSAEPDPPGVSRGDAVADLFGPHLGDAALLGRAYAEVHPQDPVVSSPVAVPPASVPEGVSDPTRWFVEVDAEELAAQSASGCSEDFADGRTVEVQGWILPLTAAQLCGIAAEDA